MTEELEIITGSQSEFREITTTIQKMVEHSGVEDGIIVLFVAHTTAAVTINENADPDVTSDMLAGFDRLIPLKDNYQHLEGNSAAHIKSSLIGVSETLLITGGKLQLGTWQGIYFCEFDGPRTRKLHIKIIRS